MVKIEEINDSVRQEQQRISDETQTSLSEMNQEIGVIIARTQDLEALVTDQRLKILDQKNDLETCMESQNQLKKELVQAKLQFLNQKEEITSLRAQLRAKGNELDELTEQLRAMEENIEAFQADHDKSQELLRESRAKYESMIKEVKHKELELAFQEQSYFTENKQLKKELEATRK